MRKRKQKWSVSCSYRSAVKESEKLVFKNNLAARKSNFSDLRFLSLFFVFCGMSVNKT